MTASKPTVPAAVDDYEAEVAAEVELIRHERDLDDDAHARARVDMRRSRARQADPRLIEQLLAGRGLQAVTAVWPGCPVPKRSATPGKGFMYGRPVCSQAGLWALGPDGITRRGVDYWISTPVFPVQRGVPGTSDAYAVLANGEWTVVAAPPKQAGDNNKHSVVPLLVKAGLRLNPKPADAAATGELLYRDRDGGWVHPGPPVMRVFDGPLTVVQVPAANLLLEFLDAHLLEVPQAYPETAR